MDNFFSPGKMNAQEALFAAIVFSSSLAVCVAPKIVTSLKTVKKIFPFLTLTTAGFLLGVQLLELSSHISSPHSHGEKHDNAHNHNHSHANDHAHAHSNSSMLGFLVAGLSFIFLLAIDTVVLKHKHCDETQEKEKHDHHHCHKDVVASSSVSVQKVEQERLGCCDTSAIKNTSSRTQVFIYILGISIHSFFEGLAFRSVGKIGSLEIGLIFHKILESFALGVPLFTSGFSFPNALALATFYASLTPIGMLIGLGFGHINQGVMSVFNGLALGSIMFMVSIEMIPPMFNHSKGNPLYKILTLFAGYITSAAVIYASHAH